MIASIIAWLRAQWAKITFYYTWDSRVVEFCSGIAMTCPGGAAFWVRPDGDVWEIILGIVAVAAPHLFSYIYERFIDPNGMDWKDIGQREWGVIAGLMVWGTLGIQFPVFAR